MDPDSFVRKPKEQATYFYLSFFCCFSHHILQRGEGSKLASELAFCWRTDDGVILQGVHIICPHIPLNLLTESSISSGLSLFAIATFKDTIVL